MAGNLTIGVDVGSTAVKAGIVDAEGSLVKYKSQIYPTKRVSNTIIEQNPDHWIDKIIAALRLFEKFNFRKIKGFGICSQVNTHIFVDKQGNSLFPAIFWQDSRAEKEALELDHKVSREQKISWWGAPMPIDSSHVLARMLWVKRNHPNIWDKTAYVLLPKDYCIYKLTGQVVTDPLSNIGLTNNNLQYIPEVLELVPGASDRIAKLKSADELVGEIEHTLPFARTPVVNGTMDAWTGLLGAGGYKENSSVYLSGTSEILGINSKSLVPTPGIIVFPDWNNVKLHAGPTQSGGASKLWFCRLFKIKPHEMVKLVEDSKLNDNTPIFLPHLQGERAPIWHSGIRGLFYGLTSKTDKRQLARSVYEGIAFSARWLLETLETSSFSNHPSINCGGGGFQSDVWNQIRSNILNKKINRLALKDPGILGAAGLAAYAVGIYPSLTDTFENTVKFNSQYYPNRLAAEKYTERFKLFKELTENSINISSKT